MKDFFDVFLTKRIAKNRTAEIEIKLTEMNKNNMIFILEMNGHYSVLIYQHYIV